MSAPYADACRRAGCAREICVLGFESATGMHGDAVLAATCNRRRGSGYWPPPQQIQNAERAGFAGSGVADIRCGHERDVNIATSVTSRSGCAFAQP
jgi:hypothetical protein